MVIEWFIADGISGCVFSGLSMGDLMGAISSHAAGCLLV